MIPHDQSSTAAPAKRDHRQEVTDSIVAFLAERGTVEIAKMLEDGVAPWQKPWKSAAMPVNPTTDKAYRGGNAVHLIATGLSRGYEDPRWMTYKQAAENGWQVRKREKGTHIRAPSYLEPDEVKAILAQPDRSTIEGQRDHALLSFLYNTGARIQEALNVCPRAIRLDPPAYVHLCGKGRKERVCPLWSETVSLLRALLLRQPRAENERILRYILSQQAWTSP